MGSLIAADYATNFQPSIELVELVLVSSASLDVTEELARLPDKAYTKTYRSLHKNRHRRFLLPRSWQNLVQRFSSFL